MSKTLFYTADRGNTAYKRISGRLEHKQEKLAVLCDYEDFICWLEYIGVTACRLCVLPKHLDFLFHEDLWSSGKPYLLTSATLSVGGDFSRYMHQTGIDLLNRKQICRRICRFPMSGKQLTGRRWQTGWRN